MKRLLVIISLCFSLTGVALADDTIYSMRVDGLACPYCAYGIEKKLHQLEGVEAIEIDLDAGLVRVTVAEGTTLDEAQMKRLFDEAGFTFRSMEISAA